MGVELFYSRVRKGFEDISSRLFQKLILYNLTLPIPADPKRRLVFALILARKLSYLTINRYSYVSEKDPFIDWTGVMDFIAQVIRENQPCVRYLMRIMEEVNPRSRRVLFNNLFLREVLTAYRRRREAEHLFNGNNPPSVMLISPSMKCNLRCKGCYANDYDRSEELSFEIVDRLIGEAKSLGVALFNILGGEPFFWKGLFEIIEKHNDIYFQVFTNGTLIDKEKVDRLFRAGNVLPIFSLEGFGDTTDMRRGEGIYEKVTGAMALLKEIGMPFGFSTTVTRENMDEVTSDDFIDSMIKRGAFIGWYFLYMPVDSRPDFSLMPTPEQRLELGRRLNLFRTTKPIFLIDFWNDAPWVGGCISGGRKYFHVNHKGDVEPCIFCHFAIDNIRSKSLLEVLTGSPLFRSIQKRLPVDNDLRKPCMIIDRPHVLREIVKETGAYPTHPSANALVSRYSHVLDQYSREVDRVYGGYEQVPGAKG